MLRIEGAAARSLIARMQEYRKVTTTLAVQVDQPFELVQRSNSVSGAVTCPAGTWLALSPNKALYPIPDEEFQRMYQRVEKGETP